MTSNIHLTDLLDKILTDIENGQETIDSALDKYPEYADKIRPEVESAQWLHQHQGSLSARPGFLIASRTYLVETIRNGQIPQRKSRLSFLITSPPLRNHLLESVSLVLLVICLVFVSHNVVLMSALSLPGEPLYPIKLSLEQVQLTASFDPEQDVQLQIQISQRRTSELIELILNQKFNAVPGAASRLEKQLQTTVASLDENQHISPAEISALRMTYKELLTTETMILSILRDTYPQNTTQYIELALKVTQNGLAALQD